MKAKTINAVICKKFDEWLASIEDEKVRNLVEKNSMITGGCIASMLLKEDINDFDVYFTNKETVLAVSRYYVEKFKKISEHKHKNGDSIIIDVIDCDDVQKGDHVIIGVNQPGRVKIHIKSAGIAGAKGEKDYQYFEGQPQEDGDAYVNNVFENISSVDNLIVPSATTIEKPKYQPVFLSANAITLSDKIQIVIRFYGEPAEIHENYDFVHCTNYWYSKDRAVQLRQGALEAILAKELVYIGSKYPVCSIIRTRKFLKRGWTINAGQYLKMCFQVSKLDLTDVNTLEDQLVGVDVAYFSQLIDAVRTRVEKSVEEKDGFKLDYGYLATIIDKMF
jgi:hypothetical protein